MMMYLISLGAGLFVGLFYSLISVRSPAPPLVALIGLLGMLAGEQIIPISKHLISAASVAAVRRQPHSSTKPVYAEHDRPDRNSARPPLDEQSP
jgi:XapX domain-containing protein